MEPRFDFDQPPFPARDDRKNSDVTSSSGGSSTVRELVVTRTFNGLARMRDVDQTK